MSSQSGLSKHRRLPSRLLVGLLLFAIANGFVINWALPHLPGQPQFVTTLDYTKAFFDQLGSARKGSLYDGEIDYSQLHCPNAERVYTEEVCSFSHAMFLGELDDMDLILEAFKKLRENTDELKY